MRLLIGTGLALAIIVTVFSASASHVEAKQLIAPMSVCPGQKMIPKNKKQRAQATKAMHCLHNYARKQQNIFALKRNKRLGQSSALKSKDIFRCKVFEHTACGRPFQYWIKKRYIKPGKGYQVGENLAWGSSYYRQPRRVMRGWINSTGHRKNLLSRSFREVGYSVAPGKLRGRWVQLWVVHFGHLFS